jgi:UDP-N-acetyl-D-glucosamine dehydrogenase
MSQVAVLRTVEAELRAKIRDRTAKAGVIGLGQVGLPLASELVRSGFAVIGLDEDAAKVLQIREGRSYLDDVDSGELGECVSSGKLKASAAEGVLADCDAVSVCVPTPLRKTKDPDLSYVVSAAESLRRHIHPGMLIILESTTYPGTTEEVIRPILEESGLLVGQDFFLCFSPERVDPGNRRYNTRNIPKVIGGVRPRCSDMGAFFYSQVMQRVVPVSSSRIAEMVKLLENTFRMINIGLANEMALMCDRMDIDVWEVIEAAATKPFGFMPFYPGPGLGGHCIPVDPFYLSWKTRQVGHESRFIELAAQINGSMPQYVAAKVQAALNDRGKAVKGSQVHIVGVAYKQDVGDVRESPAIDIIEWLAKRGATISYSDPFVPRLEVAARVLRTQPLDIAAAEADCVVIVTDHSTVDYARLLRVSDLIVDTRNRLRGHRDNRIVRL